MSTPNAFYDMTIGTEDGWYDRAYVDIEIGMLYGPKVGLWLAALGSIPEHVVYRFVTLIPGVSPEDEVATIYVGMTSDLPTRLRSHSKKWWWRLVVPSLCELAACSSREHARRLELEMIRWYRPAMNIESAASKAEHV